MTEDIYAVDPCLTHFIPGIRPCTTNDEPRPATIGYVCEPCYGRIMAAVSEHARWTERLDGIKRAIQRDPSGGGKPGSQIPIEALILDQEELTSYLATFRGTVDRWVADVADATDALKFARAMEAAARKHPTEETAHEIRRTRCPQCEQQTLVWNPPIYQGAEVRVVCRKPECKHEVDQDMFDILADIEGTTGRTISRTRIEHVDQGGRCECGEDLGPDSRKWVQHILTAIGAAA